MASATSPRSHLASMRGTPRLFVERCCERGDKRCGEHQTSPRSPSRSPTPLSAPPLILLALAHTLILRPCHFDSIYGPRARHHTCARPPLRRVHVPAACAVAALPERDGLLTPAFHLLSCSPAPASRWLMLMQLRSCADSPVRFCQECSCHDRPCPSPAAAGLRRAPLGN